MLYATSTRIIAYAASMSYRGWLVSIVLSALTYLYNASTLSHPRYNSPCVRFGAVMRVLYGLFATDFAHYVLGSPGDSSSVTFWPFNSAKFGYDKLAADPAKLRAQQTKVRTVTNASHGC